MAERFYITTAIAYPNGRPHIGHAYEAIATDAIARFQRMMGRDVFFLTGTDEHGLKMVQTARDRGVERLRMKCLAISKIWGEHLTSATIVLFARPSRRTMPPARRSGGR
jgi:methionyl-tRNA synthetase